jgi:hypothetical protein
MDVHCSAVVILSKEQLVSNKKTGFYVPEQSLEGCVRTKNVKCPQQRPNGRASEGVSFN